jgi:hypothetical protein
MRGLILSCKKIIKDCRHSKNNNIKNLVKLVESYLQLFRLCLLVVSDIKEIVWDIKLCRGFD